MVTRLFVSSGHPDVESHPVCRGGAGIGIGNAGEVGDHLWRVYFGHSLAHPPIARTVDRCANALAER